MRTPFLLLRNPSNQSMELTAPWRNEFRVFATTSYRWVIFISLDVITPWES